MEHDFLNRNEIESLNPGFQDTSSEPPLAAYTSPPPSPMPVALSMPNGNSGGGYLQNLITQMQITQQMQMQQMGWLASRPPSPHSESRHSEKTGFSLQISQDILRWLILFAFILGLVWLVFYLQRKTPSSTSVKRLARKRNPIQDELKELEEVLEENG